MLTRRMFAKAVVGTAIVPAITIGARAQTQSGGGERRSLQGAGFYRFPLGDKTLTVLADGNAAFPGGPVFAVNAQDGAFEALQQRLGRPTDGTAFAMNTMLVDAGDRRILLDAGAGSFLGEGFGRQDIGLANAGIDPASIDTVVISHGHPDHFAGLLRPDGSLRFANAEIVWREPEWNYWTDETAKGDLRRSQIPTGFVDAFINAMDTVLPAVEPNVRLVTGEHDVASGVRFLPAPGHTPHASVIVIEDGDEAVLYASDTTVLPVQHALRPEWVTAFELDPTNVVETRRRWLDRAAAEGLLWHGYHGQFPALGAVEKMGDAYAFHPAPFRW